MRQIAARIAPTGAKGFARLEPDAIDDAAIDGTAGFQVAGENRRLNFVVHRLTETTVEAFAGASTASL